MDELLQRLDAYAREALSPDPATADRMRAAVMLEARARLVPVAAAAASAQVQSVRVAEPRRGRLSLRLPTFGLRPGVAFAGAALAVLVAVGGTFAASGAGGPLYGARLWLETVGLPSDPAARLEADATRLQHRLDEASAAAAQGNGPAVQAALDAYRQEVADALQTAGTDVSRDARLAAVFAKHMAVLQALVDGGLPDNASSAATDAIQRTIVRTEQGLNQVNGNGNGNGNGVPGPTDHPTPQPHPTNTPPPHPTPHPIPTAHPTPQPHPTNTPPPHPTPKPHPTPHATPNH